MLNFIKNALKSKPSEGWMHEGRLYSLKNDRVRVEIGPQYVELPCTDANLDDRVSHPSYRLGRRDAMGRLIRPDEAGIDSDVVTQDIKKGLRPISKGETMTVVDRRARFKPHLWKVYRLTPTPDDVIKERFIKVHECVGFDEALEFARAIEV